MERIVVPKVKVFLNRGRVESVYADTVLLDVEIVECDSNGYLDRFDRQYEAAEAQGLFEVSHKELNVGTMNCDGEDRYAV